MLEPFLRPLRQVLGITEHDLVDSMHEVRDVESDTLEAVRAIENATASIERHIEVIETLATSIDPLRASVDQLSQRVADLVETLRPLSDAEHEVQRVGHLFGRRPKSS